MLRIIRSASMALVLVALTAGTALADISSFSITDATLVNPGKIQVEGTITCPATEQFYVNVSAQQTKGNNVTTGGGSSPYIQCTGTPQGWSVDVLYPYPGPFKSGRTYLNANTYAFVPFGNYETAQDAEIVSLH